MPGWSVIHHDFRDDVPQQVQEKYCDMPTSHHRCRVDTRESLPEINGSYENEGRHDHCHIEQ